MLTEKADEISRTMVDLGPSWTEQNLGLLTLSFSMILGIKRQFQMTWPLRIEVTLEPGRIDNNT